MRLGKCTVPFGILMFALSVKPPLALSQSNRISWWVMGSGFGIAGIPGASLKTAVGEPLLARSMIANTMIESGFLANPFFRSTATSASGGGDELPSAFELLQNYPNPFNPATRIGVLLPQLSEVTLTVYNVLGQEVVTLINDQRPAGYFTVEWDGTNSSGQKVSSGLYFYRMIARPQSIDGAESFIALKKMVILR